MNVVQRFYKIIVALLFSVKFTDLQAQRDTVMVAPVSVLKPMLFINSVPAGAFNLTTFNKITAAEPVLPLHLSSGWLSGTTDLFLPASITNNYYTQHFGFFCRQELKVEKASGIPFRLRLGSVEQCDLIEGKKKGR